VVVDPHTAPDTFGLGDREEAEACDTPRPPVQTSVVDQRVVGYNIGLSA
jgi:hypothetical protein